MTDLCAFAFRYGTDKCPQLGHNYTPKYYELLNNRRHSIHKVVELGIGHKDVCHTSQITGASLYMWRDFFTNATIIGIDILPQCQFEDVRIKTFQCDQTNLRQLMRTLRIIGNDIDLFVDDGLHDEDNQVSTCLRVMPFIKSGGMYIIEDVDSDKIKDRLFNDSVLRKSIALFELYTFNLSQMSNDRIVVINKR
jgi:hypothetical protein